MSVRLPQEERWSLKTRCYFLIIPLLIKENEYGKYIFSKKSFLQYIFRFLNEEIKQLKIMCNFLTLLNFIDINKYNQIAVEAVAERVAGQPVQTEIARLKFVYKKRKIYKLNQI